MSGERAKGDGEVLALFKYRFAPHLDVEEMMRLNDRMHVIATPETGLLATDVWTAEDGAYMTVYRFASARAMRDFVRHPEHQDLMRRGGDFFSTLETQITHVVRGKTSNDLPRSPGRGD